MAARPAKSAAVLAKTLARLDRQMDRGRLSADHPWRLAIADALGDYESNGVCKALDPPARELLNGAPMSLEVRVCMPADQRAHLPEELHDVEGLPPGMPLPRPGDVIYLSSSSAWAVSMVVFEKLATGAARVNVWVEHVANSHVHRPDECRLLH